MYTFKKSKEELAAQALAECTSAKTAAHPGGGPGRPYWNARSSQFMYVPSFQFPWIPDDGKYRYTCEDESGKTYSFETGDPSASLEPVWKDLPCGVIKLRVTDLNEDGSDKYTVGARTFYKIAPFPADLPERVCSYKESTLRGFDYLLNQGFIQYWRLHGKPDPEYNLNVYPSKMYASVIKAMCRIATVYPEKEAEAREIALGAANYLLGLFYPAGSPLEGLPPTYFVDFRDHVEDRNNLTAYDRKDTVMMIYPAGVGSAFLSLYDWVGDRRFYDAAYGIACYYRDHVLENGSWPLIVSVETGKARSKNCTTTIDRIVPFLLKIGKRTGEEIWQQLADRATQYEEDAIISSYNFEGQFEDSVLSSNYTNLSHYPANAVVRYYAENFADDPDHIARAADILRFSEDQFLLWNNVPSWKINSYDTSTWILPAALEQYNWYVPIDASLTDFVRTFLAMFRATGDELYLAKAMGLADAITRTQLPSGMIPTHWMSDDCIEHPDYFWINCHVSSVLAMSELAAFLGE